MMTRRSLLSLLGTGLLSSLRSAAARAFAPGETLLTAPLELGGSWGGSAVKDAAVVIERMRAASLGGVALLSDHQPAGLRVDDCAGSNPAIWLHTDAPTTAWIKVIVGARDWCNLAYQFGHELGHVLCNSWEPDAAPRNPCQWVEESLVEAFSLRGLGILADEWGRAPPFPNDGAYKASIRNYRETILVRYQAIGADQGSNAGLRVWFESREAFLMEHGGLDAATGAVSIMLGLLESDASMIADLGALNRWPGRSGLPLPDYLANWERSCAELRSSGRLPARLHELITGS
jgi:hypothetical protein